MLDDAQGLLEVGRFAATHTGGVFTHEEGTGEHRRGYVTTPAGTLTLDWDRARGLRLTSTSPETDEALVRLGARLTEALAWASYSPGDRLSPVPPDDAERYIEAWSANQQRVGTGIAFVAGALLLQLLLGRDVLPLLRDGLVLLLAAVGAGLLLHAGNWPCPRCGRPFRYRSPRAFGRRGRRLDGRCENCLLPHPATLREAPRLGP